MLLGVIANPLARCPFRDLAAPKLTVLASERNILKFTEERLHYVLFDTRKPSESRLCRLCQARRTRGHLVVQLVSQAVLAVYALADGTSVSIFSNVIAYTTCECFQKFVNHYPAVTSHLVKSLDRQWLESDTR